MKRHVYGTDAKNNDLAGTIDNLGRLYKARGEYQKVKCCFEEALE
jgi:hypothetical protein